MSDINDPRAQLINRLGIPSGNPTYTAFALAYAAYATPTDMVAVRGVAGKQLLIRSFGLAGGATAASLVTFFWYKRSAVNTGGTSAAMTTAKYDSRRAAPAAAPLVYTSAPVITDAAAAILFAQHVNLTATTAAKATVNLGNTVPSVIGDSSVNMLSPLIVLPGEELVLNFAGAALPSGFTSFATIQWSEVDIPTGL